MKKICFIIPYFGKFPNYFALFLKTCAYNKEFNWLILTDNEGSYSYPSNVRVINVSFADIQKKVQAKFDFKIRLSTPYKFCDYKPAYGYLFEEYLGDFKFWGHCDIDTLMGNLNHFLTDEFLASYDKFFCLGHMTIYRNTFDNNRCFMKPVDGCSYYRRAFTTDSIVTFDEEWRDGYNVNRIFQKYDKRIFMDDLSLNFSIFHTQFRKITFVGFKQDNDGHGYQLERKMKNLCVWDNGHIYRYYIDNGNIQKEEYLYIHLQKRKMSYDDSILDHNYFKIVPNRFLPLDQWPININSFQKERVKFPCFHYWNIIIIPKIRRLFRKILKNE